MLIKVAIIIILILLLLAVERIIAAKKIKSIPIRIHVNGTRGKSSVTEYIAAGLRIGGKRTFAKITGIKPTMIFPDGSKAVIKRKNRARVQEQVNMIYKACKCKAEALVLECMSILPELQRIEKKVIRPTVYVITNILDDHREEMGSSTDEMADAICSAMPENAIVVTNEVKYADKILETAVLRNTKVIFPEKLSTDQLCRLPDGLFPGNAELAITVCGLYGVDEEQTLNAILDVFNSLPPLETEIKINEKKVTFINGFAVNDVPSAESFIEKMTGKYKSETDLMIILNTRNDRPVRTVLFAEWLWSVKGLQKVIVSGNHKEKAVRILYDTGFSNDMIDIWQKKEIENIAASLAQFIKTDTIIIGLGNIAGDGFEIIEAFEKQKMKFEKMSSR